MKFSHIWYIMLFCSSLGGKEYLNPFVYPQMPKLDFNDTIKLTSETTYRDGSRKNFQTTLTWEDEDLDFLTYGFGGHSGSYTIGNNNDNTWILNWGGHQIELFGGRETFFVFSNRPKTNYIKDSTKWNEVTTTFFSYDHNSSVNINVKVESNSTLNLVGTKQIITPWGSLNAIEVRRVRDDYIQLKPNNFSYYRYAFVSRQNLSTSLYINGLGFYSSTNTYSNVERRDSSSMSDKISLLSIDTYSDIPSWPVPEATEIELKFIENHKMASSIQNFQSSNVKFYPKSYLPKDELSTTTTELNAWTWNGAFPWVYNHETASWFYYHFAGNTCNAYDARNGNWFTFNGTSNSWGKSN